MAISTPRFPTRYVHLDEARARHGERVDRFGEFFYEGDPVADDVVEALASWPRPARDAVVQRCLDEGVDAVPEAPEALRALMREVDHVPFWVDFDRAARGGRMFLRAGLLGGMVLGTYSLVAGYCSPAGNKPLAFSGRLEDDAPRRLAETSRFVQAVATPGGMRRHGEGFKAAVKVRLVHAAVRRMLTRSPKWNHPAWALPINQADSSGTILLFSYIASDGLGRMGFSMTQSEREDWLHLWRYVAYVMGVVDDLRCASEVEAAALWDLLSTTQAPPDEDSRALTRALAESTSRSARTAKERARAKRIRPISDAMSRYLLGDAYADGLGIPRTGWIGAVEAIRAVNLGAGAMMSRMPDLALASPEAGARYWDMVVRSVFPDARVDFAMPDTLRAAT